MTTAALSRSPRPLFVLAACVGVLAVLGGYDALVSDFPAFDLQAELRDGLALPALFSGLLLLGAAIFAALLSRGPGRDVAPHGVWLVFPILFLVASVDEMATIHERLGEAAGIDWMVLYSPLVPIAGYLWFTVLRGLRADPLRPLWIAGAAAWGLSQALEAYAYGGSEEGRPGAGAFSAAEELLEMTGSLLLLWTLVVLYRRAREGGSDQGDRAGRVVYPLARDEAHLPAQEAQAR